MNTAGTARDEPGQDKPILLMVHGLIGSLSYFPAEARIPNAAVQAFDLLGYGRSQTVDPKELTLQAQAARVTDFIDRLSSDRAVWLLGHSMGGAIVMLAADMRRDRIEGIINVEGNFTLKDAFWSKKIADMTPDEWATEYCAMQDDVPGWCKRCGIEPTPDRLDRMTHLLAHQPASTVRAMSRELVALSETPDYLHAIRRVVEHPIPIHLLAGERSADAWDVPDFVRQEAASCTVQPGAGHLMMLEQPAAFFRIVESIVTDS